MATIDDAIEMLTNRELQAGPAVGGFVQMNGPGIVEELRRRDADEEEARKLVRDALRRLKGLDKSHEDRGGKRGGSKPRPAWVDDFWVPASALRSGKPAASGEPEPA
jgi:hypothetical protein